MWLDNASNIDMLFYSPYADTIVNFTKKHIFNATYNWPVWKLGCWQIIFTSADRAKNRGIWR